MSFVEAVVSVFSNYATFKGRAIRSEYWYYVLFALLAGAATAIIDIGIFQFKGQGPVNLVYTLATFIPGLAVSVRRLHDVGRSGWWFLLTLTVVGAFVLLYWCAKKGDPAENAYGPPVSVG